VKKLGLIWLIVFSMHAFAQDKTIAFNFENEDVVKVLKKYSTATGQKFIVNPAVHGQITILNSTPISTDEAFNQLSQALAQNDVGISKQGDTMVVGLARSIQRDLIEVGNVLPSLKPERMYTWVIQLKNVSADEVNRQLRILTSRDGELVPHLETNQIIITDWVSNLYRVNEIIKQIDDPAKLGNKQFASAHHEPHPVKPGTKEIPRYRPAPDSKDKSER
jgi:general secretion pathway protein D